MVLAMATTVTDPGENLGPRARRSAERRREILDAASRTIAKRGYSGASLSEIAEAVGISAPSLLHHFKNKEQLLTDLLAYRDDISRGKGATSFDAGGQARLDHLAGTAEENARNRGLTQLYSVLLGESLTEDHPAKEFFRDRFTGLRAPLRDALLEAIGDPTVSEQDVLETAAAIVAVMDGIQFQYLLEPEAVDMAAVTRRTVRALLSDLRARTGRADEQ